MATSNKDGGAPRTGPTGTGNLNYSHADFTYVRRKRKTHQEDDSGQHELNIVPYLDILVNLIMFLLVTQATLVSLGLIDVSAPSYQSPGAGQTSPQDVEQGKNLRLTIGIAATGFFIAAKGGVLPGEEEEKPAEITADGVSRREPTIPKRGDGSYDYPALSVKLRSIKTAFPKAESLFLAADENTPYEVLVRTLDATREDARGPLFPAVAFTQMN